MTNLLTILGVAGGVLLVIVVAYVCALPFDPARYHTFLPARRKRGTYFAWMMATVLSLPLVVGIKLLELDSQKMAQLAPGVQALVLCGMVAAGCLYCWVAGLVCAHFLAFDDPFPSKLSEYARSMRQALTPARQNFRTHDNIQHD